ncbi:MAG: N-6 DNA methylase [Candidatus Tectomicrobia bacterium]|nr:N-6 DNA methylase [Candidatus Tectomicrobia bacterium]
MARGHDTGDFTWPALSLEGNLIAPAMLAKIDHREATEQSEADYGVRKGLTLREDISSAFRVGQAHFDAFARLEAPSMDATRRFIRAFLTEAFGFHDIADGAGAVACMVGGGRIPIVVVPPTEALDRRSPTLSTDRTRSPAFVLQDYLNEHDEALWGLATNGTHLRLLRDNASLTRPAHLEADLGQIFAHEDAASFAALWLLVHRSRFGAQGTPATDCALERWRVAGAREGETARDRLADQVERALRVLGSGFLEANPVMAEKLRSGEVPLSGWFNELLRFVYRLIFIMVAEDRELLHPSNANAAARTLYADGYSLAALRRHCVRRATWDRHHDRYEGMKVAFRALATGEAALALPALGGLFDADRLPHLESARLRNDAFMEAVYRLSWLSGHSGTVPVNWRAMETEELGSVYESLLELQPQLADGGCALAFASDRVEQKGHLRKTTGSYYTPDSLVQALLDTALDPVLDRTVVEANDPAEALLRLTVIDPACGSGHFLLAAARRIATRVAHIRADGAPSLADFRHALRDVARRCLHGVDRNPMAVELTQVALWIETVDPGLPLGFFDAQVRCGDALLGVFDLAVLEDGVPDAAYKVLTGDDKVVAKHYLKANRAAKAGQGVLDFSGAPSAQAVAKPLAAAFSDFRVLPEETVQQIGAKARHFSSLRKRSAFIRVGTAADTYVAAFLCPKTPERESSDSGAVPTTEHVWRAFDRGDANRTIDEAVRAAQRARAFHWPLEFPDVMARGGFDVVLGNPPWEVMQLSEKEYFASRNADIAILAGAARKRAIGKLEHTDPAAFQEFITAKHGFDAVNQFVRVCGRFNLTAKGKINTYSLFAELFLELAKKRAGAILPTGIVTDFHTRDFFQHLIGKNKLISAMMFDNAWAVFPAVHPDNPFVLLSIGKVSESPQFGAYFLSTEHLIHPERRYRLSGVDISRINPNTLTAPLFRTRADAELTAKIYSKVPVMIDERKGEMGNPWGVDFRQGLFNMTSDSGLFRTARQLAETGFERDETDWVREVAQEHNLRSAEGDYTVEQRAPLFRSRGEFLEVAEGRAAYRVEAANSETPSRLERYVPLYESKMIHQFDHRWAGYDEAGQTSADLSLLDKQDPSCEPAPRYWVPEDHVAARLKAKGWDRDWLIGWRRITNATNERTVISTVFPRVGAGDNLFLMLFNIGSEPKVLTGIIANLCTLTLDYTARQKVGGTNLNFFVYQQLPLLPPAFYSDARLDFTVQRVLELTYTSAVLSPFAEDLGYDGHPFPWDEDRRAHLRADLDAFYARAYGLTREELRYILDPSDVNGPNYPSESFRVLRDKETRQYGEYRTRRLVLAAWDRMEASGEFSGLGL